MFEFIDVLIVGAILYYIVQAVRRAASAQADRRPPGSIAVEEGESLTWTERTQRALEGALEWEEEQQRKREEAELRAELAAVRARERGGSTPWGERRDEHRRRLEKAQRKALPTGAEGPSLSDALAGVAAMLEQQSRAGSEPSAPRESTELTLRSRADVRRAERAEVARRPRPRREPPVIEVEAQKIRGAGPSVERPASRPVLTDLPGLGRLTPLQRAIVYGEIFGRPVALGGSGIDDPLD